MTLELGIHKFSMLLLITDSRPKTNKKRNVGMTNGHTEPEVQLYVDNRSTSVSIRLFLCAAE